MMEKSLKSSTTEHWTFGLQQNRISLHEIVLNIKIMGNNVHCPVIYERRSSYEDVKLKIVS